MISDVIGASHIPGIRAFPGSGWESPFSLPCYSATPKLLALAFPPLPTWFALNPPFLGLLVISCSGAGEELLLDPTGFTFPCAGTVPCPVSACGEIECENKLGSQLEKTEQWDFELFPPHLAFSAKSWEQWQQDETPG